MGQCTGTLGTRTWHGLCRFVLLAEQKGMTDPASRSSWTCCTDKSPHTGEPQHSIDLALVAVHLHAIHLYHPESNRFTIRYWELWAAVTHHRWEACLCHPAGRPCGWQELRLPPGCADLQQKPSRPLSRATVCSSPRGWGEQQVVASVLCFSALACDGLALHNNSHGCV